VVQIDGIHFHEHVVLIALGIDAEGRKHVLGLREGTTENASVVRALLADLVDRGLSPERAPLFAIDGAKALRKALTAVFGSSAIVQRCQVHYAEPRIMPSWDRKPLWVRDSALMQSA
jgi:transposase-like protein